MKNTRKIKNMYKYSDELYISDLSILTNMGNVRLKVLKLKFQRAENTTLHYTVLYKVLLY